MRRARIKAVATVPVRRKALQSAVKDETNNSNDNKTNENKDNDNNMNTVPRLNNNGRIRSNSIHGSGASASESEDDSKRVTNNATNNRTRNDSICSVQSNKEVSNNTPSNTVTKTKTSQKRRILISESARKLAEARREFLLKHENKTPDRAKLTMYDLIYYNPVGNPMKTSNEPVKSSTRTESTSEIEKELEEEEEEDDPSSMPVPQVKVGADGQLVIDEQSLVIEQSHAKKSRELFAKKAIVDDDNYGSGFYKRRPKGKEWPKWETLKFYKALNIVGTDFLLMQTLFPNRTRQEIKLKYKKEERLNRRLIEKALEFHQEFSPEMEEDLAKFEASIRQQCSTEKEVETKNKEKKKLKRRQGSRFAARSVGEIIASDEDDVMESEMGEIQYKDVEANNNQFLQKSRKRCKLSVKKTHEVAATTSAITTTTTTLTKENGKTSSLISDQESDSDAEIYQIRPTRSGRVPKVRKLQGPDVNNLDNIDTEEQLDNTEETLLEIKDEKTIIKSTNTTSSNTNLTSVNSQVNPAVITSAIPNISEVEPGSLVILSNKSPEEGKTVLQVYMVSSNCDIIDNQVENNIAVTETNSLEVLTMTPNVSSDIQSVAVKKENE
ncbi:general transcriptional corepressor trfA [Polistes fuscatus]|uniref:general transcriptional corepressor trfA n=1 Tax=Polistes fuscatus TaxID=30207 RepID=UPI001CA806E9|nr:general transcriptional corepressor trfA [Polistes fuscatus]